LVFIGSPATQTMPPAQLKLYPGCWPQHQKFSLRHESRLVELVNLLNTVDPNYFRKDVHAVIEEGWARIAAMQLLIEIQ
jgi:hypothetical protein